MPRRKRLSPPNVHESFSDIALLMLATFIFLLVTILITSKLAQDEELPRLKAAVAELEAELARARRENSRLHRDMDQLATLSTEAQMERALEEAGITGKHRKDFDLFVAGLRDLPGDTLHLVVDATGSMHGVSGFLVPVLRIIVIRSGKRLSAITWFSNRKAQTLRGSMGEMLDQLMSGAPFIGGDETIGHAFRYAAEHAPAPGAYLLIGDEPATDRIYYTEIPAPVFTLPLGRLHPDAEWEYRTLAERTGGRMLRLELR